MENEKTWQAYEWIVRLLTEEKMYWAPSHSFRGLCRLAGARPGAVDAVFRAELGMSGRAYMECLRAAAWGRVCALFGAPVPGQDPGKSF